MLKRYQITVNVIDKNTFNFVIVKWCKAATEWHYIVQIGRSSQEPVLNP